MLGLSGINITPLHKLFGALGFSDVFESADKKHRRDVMNEGCEKKFGVDNVFKLADFQEQAVQTRTEKYGGAYTLSGDSVLSGVARHTMSEHMKDETFVNAIIQKRKNTLLANYGVEHPSQSSEIREKIQQTSMERYGVPHYMKSDIARESARAYMLEHSKEILEKSRNTCLQRYGVDYYGKTDESRIREHGTLNTSEPEAILYNMLVSVFGSDDVISQYADDRYPFFCDFYIKSRDLFIELNATWTHNSHWYNGDNYDMNTVYDWVNRGVTNSFYTNALETWTVRDVNKRKAACSSNLNYVVFWNSKLDDARLWFAMGCPDGCDWDREYSWLPYHELQVSDEIPELKSGWKNVVASVRSVNWREFYKRELLAWKNNLSFKNGKLVGALYANRYKYLGKLPNELTDFELLRGMNISGMIKGYSVFNNTAMEHVLQEYNLKYVYDPCAGWGERMLTCALHDIGYLGVDINPVAVHGHDKLRQFYGLIGQATIVDDGSVFDMSHSMHDAVITCPPYWNKEIYTERGAENFSREDFMKWWKRVVDCSISSTVKVFAYQISGDLCHEMDKEIFRYGFKLVNVIDTKGESVRHFQRKSGRSVAREFMRVFVR